MAVIFPPELIDSLQQEEERYVVYDRPSSIFRLASPEEAWLWSGEFWWRGRHAVVWIRGKEECLILPWRVLKIAARLGIIELHICWDCPSTEAEQLYFRKSPDQLLQLAQQLGYTIAEVIHHRNGKIEIVRGNDARDLIAHVL